MRLSCHDIVNAIRFLLTEAKEEYIARYLDGNIGKHTWPPTESYKPNLTDQTKSDHGPLSPDLTSRLPPLDITPEEAAQLGYMPQRDDFEWVRSQKYFALGVTLTLRGHTLIIRN